MTPRPEIRPLPLSFAQQRLWFVDQLDPGSAVYNVPRAIPERGVLNVGGAPSRRLNCHCQSATKSLRTTFRRSSTAHLGQ